MNSKKYKIANKPIVGKNKWKKWMIHPDVSANLKHANVIYHPILVL